MKISGILILFLNLVASVTFWAVNTSLIVDYSIQSNSEIAFPELAIQQSSILEIGDALTNRTAPERPVVRTVHNFFKSQTIANNFSGLSAICQASELNYNKAAFTLDTNLPAFLIVFPHHYFT
ncbi:hypothetical protein [Algoriphagus yeomjeoni]|uniref:Uncharacterized protein n=1 Tax=Algoriphagus yeomjeoni TaxID=291403 RepID=A0A327PKF4_9BACT|nr:hypothetical protein [Algoriphagus yeomjeoni]RAI92083.1 hypothetical protein LV83_01311 [Algoriphagus yeomjeoni]